MPVSNFNLTLDLWTSKGFEVMVEMEGWALPILKDCLAICLSDG